MEFYNKREEVDLTRHRLSHWRQGGVPVFVTFRLSDSLPKEIFEAWLLERECFIADHALPWDDPTEGEFHRRFTQRIDDHLDSAHGCCVLRDPKIAEHVVARLKHFDQIRYHLLSFVIMPNHVHVLFLLNEGQSLAETLKGWKGVSSRFVHRDGLSDLNPFWQPDYFDRLIRSPEHLDRTFRYIRENPAKAGLNSGFNFWEAEP